MCILPTKIVLLLLARRPVATGRNRFLIGLSHFEIVVNRRPDRGYGLVRSWLISGPDRLRSGPVSVFFQSFNWTYKH